MRGESDFGQSTMRELAQWSNGERNKRFTGRKEGVKNWDARTRGDRAPILYKAKKSAGERRGEAKKERKLSFDSLLKFSLEFEKDSSSP